MQIFVFKKRKKVWSDLQISIVHGQTILCCKEARFYSTQKIDNITVQMLTIN